MNPGTLPTMPSRMRAARIGRYGAAQDVFEVVDDTPIPPPAKDEVLVRHRATSINPIDCRRRGRAEGKVIVGFDIEPPG
jgi:NADPH:quinone reductase-like Zn-dependent oxidoreductase